MAENHDLNSKLMKQTGFSTSLNDQLTSKLRDKNKDLVVQNGVLS